MTRRFGEWTLGVTTAPRRLPTLSVCVTSLAQAGWFTPRLFVEPDASIPSELSGLSMTHRDEKLGAFANWYLGLAEMYVRKPLATAYLICQDDVLFSRGLREYLEHVLWPAAEIGVVSLYCPSHEHRDGQSGFVPIDPGWGAWGALAYIFSNPGVRAFLSDPEVVNHRHHGPAQGERNIDSVVGAWCRRRQVPYFVHVPSLAQHIGETSTIWKKGGVGGRRAAICFDPEFPARQLNNHRETLSIEEKATSVAKGGVLMSDLKTLGESAS